MPNAALRTARAYRTARARSLQRRTWRRLDARRRADGFSTDTPLGTQPCWCAEYSTQRVANWQGLGRPAGLIHRKSWKDSLSRSSRTTVDAHLHTRHCELHHTHSGAVSHSMERN
jgi:hypothetical protein